VSPLIQVEGLVKTFGRVRALDRLDLEVAEGEVHGFLGPNGAGKTTTIRVLLGLIQASAGRVRLFGRDPWRDATELHRRLAYVPGDVALWPTLTGGEVIDLLTRLRGHGPTAPRRAELLERFELDPRKRCRTYSKGNRQKVALVAALASPVELLILDEPTSGLDPVMEAVFRDVIADEHQRGRTVLLSSHILGEVEALCDRVSIVRAGRTVESAPLSQLRGARQTAISAELTAQPADPAALAASLPGTEDADLDGARLRCHVTPEHLNDLLTRLAEIGVHSLTSGPPTLEELFLSHYRTPATSTPSTGADASTPVSAGGRR